MILVVQIYDFHSMFKVSKPETLNFKQKDNA